MAFYCAVLLQISPILRRHYKGIFVDAQAIFFFALEVIITGYRPIITAAQSFSNSPVHIVMPSVPSALHDRLDKPFSLHGINGKWHRPVTLEQMLKLRADNPSSRLIGGGTDFALSGQHGLLVKLCEENSVFIETSRVQELQAIKLEQDSLVIGAAVTIYELLCFLQNSQPNMVSGVRTVHFLFLSS